MIKPDILAHSPYFKVQTPSGRGVVIHATRSGTSMNPTEFQGTLNWFRNNPEGLAAHWVISRTGIKARVVNDDCICAHAGIHNPTHWAIELEQGVESDGFTAPQIAACIEVSRGYVTDFNVPVVRVMPVSAAPGFVGHQDTPQGRSVGKSDPGSGFPWQYFIDALSGNVAPPPAPVPRPNPVELKHVMYYLPVAVETNNPKLIHPYDVGVLERAVAWLKGA